MDELNRFSVIYPGAIADSGSNAHCLLLGSSSELNREIPLHLLINDAGSSGVQYIITLPKSQLQHHVDWQEDAGALTENVDAETHSSEGTIQKQATTSCQKTIVNSIISKSPKITAVKKQSATATSVSTSNIVTSPQENITKLGNKILNYVHIPDSRAPPRAVAVLPAALRYRGGAVTARCSLPPRVRFGPVSGSSQKMFTALADELMSEATHSQRAIFLCKREDESVYHIDMSDEDRSNWFSLLPLGDQTSANVWLYEEEDVLYGITTKVIPPRTPLALGYSKLYAETHQMSPEVPVLDLQEALRTTLKNNQKLSTFTFLQRHGVDFKDEKLIRRKYRCSQCRKTFSRLFTLRRHMSRFCTRKTEKETSSLVTSCPQEEKQTNPMQCSTPLIDDTRMPSDESLQNYTNVLDFSTNLFDTDRMSNLDISGSSKSEAEFNPCHIENSKGYCSNKTDKKTEEKIFVICTYCNLPVTKQKYRNHYRECPDQRLECKCGKVFHKKENLSNHILEKHFDDFKKSKTMEPETMVKGKVEAPYKCDECKIDFKRRGMLVNHAWRVHKRRAALPVERRVRHYPCAGCANIYRTAAKRDAHARKHHPGMEMHGIEPIEGERRRCEAAACPACPRQYVTRAKMLQHLRAHHPHLEAPSKITIIPKTKRKK